MESFSGQISLGPTRTILNSSPASGRGSRPIPNLAPPHAYTHTHRRTHAHAQARTRTCTCTHERTRTRTHRGRHRQRHRTPPPLFVLIPPCALPPSEPHPTPKPPCDRNASLEAPRPSYPSSPLLLHSRRPFGVPEPELLQRGDVLDAGGEGDGPGVAELVVAAICVEGSCGKRDAGGGWCACA